MWIGIGMIVYIHVCLGAPYPEEPANFCMYIYDIELKELSGCFKLVGCLHGYVLEDIKLGCFNLPSKHLTPTLQLTKMKTMYYVIKLMMLCHSNTKRNQARWQFSKWVMSWHATFKV